MKRWLFFPFCAAVSVLLLSGCASTSDAGDDGKKSAVTQLFSTGFAKEGHSLAESYVDAFAAAMQTGNYAALPELAKGKVSDAMFKKMVDNITSRRGKLVSHAFVTTLDQTLVRDYLWKFSFEKASAEAGGRQVRTEVIYLVRVGVMDGKPVIAGFGFSR